MHNKETKGSDGFGGYKNNKVYICPFIVIGITFGLLLAIFCFVFPWIDQGEINDNFTLRVFIVLLIVLLFFIGLFLWSLITMAPAITVDEKGMHKALFGVFFKKSILWEEIAHIRYFGTQSVVTWIVFSKSNIRGMSFPKCQRRRDTIYVGYSEKLDYLVKKYYGKSIEEISDKL